MSTRQMAPRRPEPKGRIITFYSYKGGTGRSMAVANVAWILALSGERVLVVDWDLEAPGIHRYFHPFLDDKELLNTEGLLDFADRAAGRAAVASGDLQAEDIDIVEYITMLKWPASSSLSWESFGPRAKIDLLVAGRQGPSYSTKLNAFNWIDFYEKLGGRRLLDFARRQMKDVYDYVLIDSRTGVSDTSGICTVEMPDTVVVCFTLNDQSIIGASNVATSVLSQRTMREAASNQQDSPPFRIFPVPTRVEVVSEQARRQIALAFAQQQFSRFIDHVRKDSRARYWGRVQLAYFPFYAFEEIPAVFADQPNQDFSLTTPIKQITRFITDNGSLELTPLDENEEEAERLRKEVLGWYMRASDGTPLDPVQVAQATYDQFDRASQAAMKKVMLRLIQISVGATPGLATRLIDDFEKPVEDMVQRLAESGIVQISGTSAVIADKRIVEGWDLLRQWARDDEMFLLWRQGLTVQAGSWHRAGRDPSALLRGKLLKESAEWLASRSDDLNEVEREFITSSKKFEDQRTSSAIVISIPGTSLRFEAPAAVAVFLLAVVLASGGWFISYLWSRFGREPATDVNPKSQSPAIVTLARQRASSDPLLSALLLSELMNYSAGEDERAFALQIASTPFPEIVLRSVGPLRSLVFARNGRTFLTAGDAGVELWDARQWTKIRDLTDNSVAMVSASFNGWVPDRAKLRGASGQIDRIVTTSADGLIQVWTLDGNELMKLDAAKLGALFFSECRNLSKVAPTKRGPRWEPTLGKPEYARFSPDEAVVLLKYTRTLLMADSKKGSCFDMYDLSSGGALTPDGEWVATRRDDNSLRWFHVQDWKEERLSPPLLGIPVAVSFHRHVLAQSGEVLDPAGSKSLWPSPFDGKHGDFSWDSKYAVGSFQNDAFWAPLDRLPSAHRLMGHQQTINAVSFEPSGAHILTASDDKTIRVWPTQRKVPNPASSWQDVVAYLRNSTRVCLTPGERAQALNEPAAAADENAKRCEAQHK